MAREEESTGRSWKTSRLDALRSEINSCRLCGLCNGRTNAVAGEGPEDARIFLLGEAPGAEEDRTGRPFVGRAGRILEDCLSSAGLERGQVFITNTVKCRPAKNRPPSSEEVKLCRKYLDAQLGIVKPSVIVTLGRVPLGLFIRSKRLGREPFRWDGYMVVPAYHPAAALHGIPNVRSSLTESLKLARSLSENGSSAITE
jgi:DNA polymerase